MTPSKTRSDRLARTVFTRLLPAAPLALAGAARTAPAALPTSPVEWPLSEGGNGHVYEYVVPTGTPAISWTEARDAAAARTFSGINGHLATITSEAEQQFLVSHISLNTAAGPDAWIGGFQPPGVASPRQRWTWITGEPFDDFTAWRAGEPNDWFGDEQYLSAAGTGGPGMWLWNDNYVDGVPAAYLVEYELAPEPAGAAILCLSGVAMLLRRRR